MYWPECIHGIWYMNRIPDVSNSPPPSFDTAKSTGPFTTEIDGDMQSISVEEENVAFLTEDSP
jgi:hypothetical protein